MGKHRGLPAAHIAVPCENGPDPFFQKKIQIDEVAGSVFSDRFETAHHAPISLGKILDDIGFVGATPVVKEILEGAYVYPPGMDKHTRMLL